MSEQITHLAILDDTRRLAVGTDQSVLADPVRSVLDRRYDAARMGSLSRGNSDHLLPIVKKAREYWAERAGEEHFERTFAFGLGWHTHRATDRYFKPVFRELDPKYEERKPRKPIKYYHEAVLYEEVYDGGQRDPFVEGTLDVTMRAHAGAEAVDVPRVEELFQSKWMVEQVGAHEFVVGTTDPPEWPWVDDLIDNCQNAYESYPLREYELGRYDPDPELFQTFINEPPFYDGSDPIIELARAVQRDEETDHRLSEVLENPGESQYAEALRKSFGYLEMASDFFEGTAGEREAAEHYGIEWKYQTDDGWDSPAIPEDADAEPNPRPHQSMTEVALTEDLCRLVLWDEALSERTRESLVDNREAAALGALVPDGEWLLEYPLDAPRSRFAYRRQNSRAKIALTVGALTVETARSHFGDDPLSDEQIARDVTIARARSGRVHPDDADVDEIADLFAGLLPRCRQRWHTLRPDTDNVEAWAERFFAWRDDLAGDVDRYATAYADGMVAGSGFYDAENPLIRLARAPKDGLSRQDIDFERALSNAASGEACAYAEVLADGVEHVRAVDAYVDKRDDGEALRARLD